MVAAALSPGAAPWGAAQWSGVGGAAAGPP